MKKLILVVVLFTGAAMQAQFFKIGIKGGANFANLGTTDVKVSDVISYHAGLVTELKLFENFSVQPEFLYSTQTAIYENTLTEVKNELGYLSIPIMAKFYLNKKLSLEIGPQFSFLLNQKNNFDIKDAETYDFALAGGLGFKITKHFFIQARYGLGLTEISKDANVTNSVFQLSIGLL